MASDLEKAISTIGVIGGGQMGSGIAQLAATAGFSVLLHDSDPAALGRAEGIISASLRRLASKGLISQVSLSPFIYTLQLSSILKQSVRVTVVVSYCVR